MLDGSNLDTTYHFNWGWSGYGDGFYAMNNLAPGSGGAGGNATYTFNSGQGAIFGIQPVPEVFDTIVLYDKENRKNIFLGDLKEQEYGQQGGGKSQPSKQEASDDLPF